MVVKMVGRGEAWIGLTDSDDISAEQREGLPVVALPISDETLLLPNTVAVVRGAPHRPEALALFEYLQRPEVLEKLVMEHALEGASSPSLAAPCLKVNWEALLGDLGEATTNLSEIFLR